MTLKSMLCASATAFVTLSAGQVLAADLPYKAAPPVVVAETCKAAISTPAFGGVITANPSPSCWTSPIGDLYFGGALTGYAYNVDNRFYPDAFAPPVNTSAEKEGRVAFSNAHAHLQKADGPFQFFVTAGLYSIPTLGLPIYSTTDQNGLLFGPVPVAFGKYQINDEWSIQGGRMFTNIGSELLFTYQNLNIARGLLFNQENFINHGVQVNYASGPWAASLAVTDGFYSGELNWVTGLITYKIDDSNTIGVNGGTHFSNFNSATRGTQFQYATPLLVQNSSIVSVNYTYSNGPIILAPYAQYTSVDRDDKLGIVGAETWSAALLGAYKFTENFAIAGRFEWIEQSGNRLNPGLSSNLLYGAGSSAFSYTVTPTYTWDRYFIRGEYSLVEAKDIQRGDGISSFGTGFGRFGNKSTQERYMIEGGVTF